MTRPGSAGGPRRADGVARDATMRRTHEWFEANSGWAPPDPDTLSEWLADGGCRSPDGCWVVARTECSHGLATWAAIQAALERDGW
jgi:hypothetical protein